MSENNSEMNEGSILIPKISLVEKFQHKNEHHQSKKPNKKMNKILKYFLLFLAVLFVFFGIVALLSFNVYKKGLLVRNSVRNVEAAFKEQDMEKIKSEINNTKKALKDLKNAYNTLSFSGVIPFAGTYYADGKHTINAAGYSLEAGEVLIEAIEPYADLIGFKSKEETVSAEPTAQERLDFVVKTIPELIPKTDLLTEKLSLIKKEVDYIDPDRYPEKVRGKEVRSRLKSTIELIDQSEVLLKNGKPLLGKAHYMLGADEGPRNYLILFQNDKELRPTGGFLTAYSIGKVDKGRFEPVLSSDIYNLDSKYTPKIKAPEPIIKYLKGPYTLSPNLRLRDMNWSPDFSESMELFTREAETAGIDGIDGVISVDTQVLVNLLKVTGPISVPGFGNFTTDIIPECRCPQVIYELESFADVEGPVVWSQDEPGKIIFAPPNYDNRKKIIGPLMNSVLANVLAQPKDKFPALFEAIMKSLTEKHILFYLYDESAQEALVKFGIAGTVTDYDKDYLLINDSNLGGRKSNLYVTQDVSQEVSISNDGAVTKTLTITYKNPEKYDGWLNSVLPNWVRVYVPKGSELISLDGLEEKEDPYEELGKTVFSGFFQLRPQGAAKVTIRYKLPGKQKGEYKLFIQKQPGKDSSLYSIKVGKKLDEFFLKTDKELKYKIQ